MTDTVPGKKVDWLSYRAHFGIHAVLLNREDVWLIQEDAIKAALEDDSPPEDVSPDKPPPPNVRILDTFLTDSSDKKALNEVCKDENRKKFPIIHILLANPFGAFAKKQHSVLSTATKPVQKTIDGLLNIARALKVELLGIKDLPAEVTVDQVNKYIQDLQSPCKKRGVKLKFFDVFPYGPMYFYHRVLVAGRFGVAKDCLNLPWYMIINDNRCKNDLFDYNREEFEDIWENSEELLSEEQPPGNARITQTHCDVFLICALQMELEAVKHAFGTNWDKIGPGAENQVFYKTSMTTDKQRQLTLVAAMPNQKGNTAAACLASKAIAAFRPRAIILVGIAAGVKSAGCNYGDILVAQHAVDYSSGKLATDKDGQPMFQPEFNPVQLPPNVHSCLRGMGSDGLDDIWRRWQAERPDKHLQVLIGPLASGELVVAHESVSDEVKSHWRRLVGIEMEAYGVYYAANTAAEPKPLFCCFKSVCDFAGPGKKDDWQSFAAFTAAEYCCYFLRREADNLLFPSAEA